MSATNGTAALSYAAIAIGKYTKEDGAAALVTWVNEQPDFSAAVFREVCDTIGDRRRADNNARKPTIRDLIQIYEGKVRKAKQKDRTAAAGTCSFCGGRGWLYIIIAGSAIGDAAPVMPSELAEYGYATTSAIPCRCDLGQRSTMVQSFGREALRHLQEYYGVKATEANSIVSQIREMREAKKTPTTIPQEKTEI